MNFELDDDQRLLADSAERFLTQQGQYEWQHIIDAGWLSLPFAEADGGLGGRLQDSMVLFQHLAKGLIVDPLWVNAYLAGAVVKRIQHPQREQWLSELMLGQAQFAVAIHEYEHAFSLTHHQTKAEVRLDGYCLNGSKCCVLNGEAAQHIFVLAQLSDQPALFVVKQDQPGVTILGHRLVDGARAAEVRFQNVLIDEVSLLSQGIAAVEIMQQALHESGLARMAEACGIIDLLVKDTLSFVKTRQQFGVSIGSFQALQHRLVDMFMMSEQCRSLLLAATLKAEQLDADAEQTFKHLQSMIKEYGQKIAQEAIQMHGGMGMTHEVNVGRFLKRLLAIGSTNV